MHDPTQNTGSHTPAPANGPRSQLGLYRTYLTSPEHRRYITVGRANMLSDTLATLRDNIGKKPKHHQLFIAPRGSGKTHFLSLVEDEINQDPALKEAYQVVRFPEEANRVCSFTDFLLTICEILRTNSPVARADSLWESLYNRLSIEEDDSIVCDTLTKAIRGEYKKNKRVLLLLVENLNQIMEEQIKKLQSIQALRGFLMGDNGCLLIATAPMYFGALTQANQPFYDFFDIQVLDLLSAEDTISLIRRNLEWDKRDDILNRFEEIRPKLRAIHTMTGGSPRLTIMLYELITTESIIAVKEQFMMLQDRITPFYQDRMRDLSPQERAVLETIASMRDRVGQPAQSKTPGNIARLMRMSQQQVSSLLQRLTKALYLISSPNPVDARSSLYTIREGFFDLWLAMNISRASQQRIPLLSDFFTAFYTQEEARQQKRAEYWKKLDAGEFNADAAENLSYLSTMGSTDEQAHEKMKLYPRLVHAGDYDGSELLKKELSLIPIDPTGRWISEHLNSKGDNYLDEISELIHCWETKRQGGLESFAQRLREIGDQLSYKTWSSLRIEFLTDQVETIPVSQERVEIRLKLASFLREQARWNEAGRQGKAAVEESETLKNNDLIAWAYNDYAQLLQDTNQLSEAEPLMHRSLAITESSYGKDHPKVATRLNNLAQLLQDTNRLSEAEPLMRRALAIDETSYGKDHPNVATRLNNLALVLKATNRLSEAEPLMRRTLAIDEASNGMDHPDVAIDLNNLAQLLQDTNRLSEAEPLMVRALAIDEASYGKDHPTVAIRLNNLAQLLQATNRLSEAEPLMRNALAIDEASYDKDNPNIARDLNNLGLLLNATNRLDEAKPLILRALEILLQFTCDTLYPHPSLKIVTENYFNLLLSLENSKDEALDKIARLYEQFGVELPVL